MAVTLDRVALRSSAYAELHAEIATAGGYGAQLERDESDDTLAATMAALGRCDDERCALSALRETGLDGAFAERLPGFLASEWQERALVTRAAIDRARAALGVEAEPLLMRLASDLALSWPARPVVVDVVSRVPSPRRRALLPVALAARSNCFAAFRSEGDRERDARIMDCVLARAVISLADRSRIHAALAQKLEPSLAKRAWVLLVVHAVAATLTAWERRHASVLRQSANAVEPRPLAWLAENWHKRQEGEDAEAFAARYASAL